MSLLEFIELYLNASEEVKERIEHLLEDQPQSEQTETVSLTTLL